MHRLLSIFLLLNWRELLAFIPGQKFVLNRHHLGHFRSQNSINRSPKSVLYHSQLINSETKPTDTNLSAFLDRIASFCDSFQGANKLRSHPGYAFGLGSNKWAFNGYLGTIDSWSNKDGVQWMSKSVVIKELDFGPSDKSATSNVDDTSTMSSSAPSTVSSLHPNRTDFQIDLDGFASTNKDVPFLKMRIIQSDGRITIWLDYIPRYELLSNLQYFDTYYRGVDQAHYELLQRIVQTPSFVPLSAPSAVITRLLMSPLAVYVGGSVDDVDGMRVMGDAVTSHLVRWKSWVDGSVDQASSTTTASKDSVIKDSGSDGQVANTANLLRDVSLYQQWFQESKVSIAELIGGSFAPKATEVSLSIMGPDFIPITDVLNSPKKVPGK